MSVIPENALSHFLWAVYEKANTQWGTLKTRSPLPLVTEHFVQEIVRRNSGTLNFGSWARKLRGHKKSLNYLQVFETYMLTLLCNISTKSTTNLI